MFRNYLRIAIRNLRKNKVYSIINLTGLAAGLCVFWMMALYIADELSYDRSSENADRIYRVVHSADWAGGSFRMAITPAPFAPALKKDYSEIAEAARVDPEGGGIITYQEKKINAGDILFSDASLLRIFKYPFLYGDPGEALSKPQSIVLTKSLAEKLFGNAEQALNKTLYFQNNDPVLVTGVMEDIPVHSQLTFSALRSLAADYTDSWQDSHLYTYLLLNKGADAKKLEAKFPGFFDRYLRASSAPGAHYLMELQPLGSIHLHSNLEYDSRNGDIRYIYLFAAVALLILVIAIINYINLSTARSSVRVREIGVRKVVGSGRTQLIGLFLTESVLFTLIAAVMATLLANIALPWLNQLSGKNLSIWEFGTTPTLLTLFVFALMTGVVGGMYPAFFLSGFRTIPALKGLQGNLQSTILFRKSLVTFQFVITILLIAGSGILYMQLRYMMNKDLGFNKDQVLTFHIPDHSMRTRVEDLKTRLLQNTRIEAAAAAGNPIGNNDIGSNDFKFEENGHDSTATSGQIATTAIKAQYFYADADYLPTMQIKLAKGRNFSAAAPTDLLGSVLVNETLVKQMGWTDPIGKRVHFDRSSFPPGSPENTATATVVGVVKDFNIYSLQHKIEPLVLEMPPVLNEEDNLYVRVKKNNVSAALDYVAKVYRQFDKNSTFEYHFLDENFANQYEAEKKQGHILLVFTTLAIFIAALGLFGLVTFSVEQRTKEIGIRKVLGAGVGRLVTLLSWDLVKPVGLAALIATPLAWWAMSRWLEGFAYRIDIRLWIFVAAGLLATAIALLTVGLKAMRAAKSNPVNALRSE